MKQSFAQARGLAALMLWALAFAANAAGPNKPLPDPADANAPVPPTRYTRFTAAAPSAARTSSPAENWKELNRTVASYDSMSLTMDLVEPKPSEPAPAAKPDPHAHHRPGADK
jgi:hypothetical protein